MNSPPADVELEAVLDYLKRDRGCDLTGYKRSTLERRLERRMRTLSIADYRGYLHYLQTHANEYRDLLDEVLINVTGFFRDPDAWDYLATRIIPRIVADSGSSGTIRLWSAGCASGQEIYSLLILFAQAIGIEACLEKIQGYATDIDEDALTTARKGVFDAREIENIPVELLEKYFAPTEGGYEFHPKLRRAIVFGRHDLVKDAPMSKIDLLLCRNTLIYFTPEVQASIFARFHFALRERGFLFLGKSEMAIHRRSIFTPTDLKHRFYTKGLDLDLEETLSLMPRSWTPRESGRVADEKDFWRAAFENSPLAGIAVGRDGRLSGANDRANELFGFTIDDRQRPFRELEIGKLIKSRLLMSDFYRDRHPLTVKAIPWRDPTGASVFFDITVVSIFNASGQWRGNVFTFLDTTERESLRQQLTDTSDRLADTSGALAETKSILATTRLELESVYQEMRFLEEETE